MNTNNIHIDNDRVVELIESFRYKPTEFAKAIGVIPSRITNITQKRNKPSLDIVQKILINFTNVNPYWLILGEGEMVIEEKQSADTTGALRAPLNKSSTKNQKDMEIFTPDHYVKRSDLEHERGTLEYERELHRDLIQALKRNVALLEAGGNDLKSNGKFVRHDFASTYKEKKIIKPKNLK